MKILVVGEAGFTHMWLVYTHFPDALKKLTEGHCNPEITLTEQYDALWIMSDNITEKDLPFLNMLLASNMPTVAISCNFTKQKVGVPAIPTVPTVQINDWCERSFQNILQYTKREENRLSRVKISSLEIRKKVLGVILAYTLGVSLLGASPIPFSETLMVPLLATMCAGTLSLKMCDM